MHMTVSVIVLNVSWAWLSRLYTISTFTHDIIKAQKHWDDAGLYNTACSTPYSELFCSWHFWELNRLLSKLWSCKVIGTLTRSSERKAQSPTSSLTKLDLSGSKVADLTSLPTLTNWQTLTLPTAPSSESAVMPEIDSQAQACDHCRVQR